MKKLFYLYCSLVLCVLASCAGQAGGAEEEARLRVMTYNIHHCNPPSKPDVIDIEAIARVINEAEPDLVALQEVDVFTGRSGSGLHQARELGRLTGMHAWFFKSIDHQGGEYGNAILSRYPLLDSAGYSLPGKEGADTEPRTLALIRVEIPGNKEITFASTHLDHTDKETNLLQARRITENLEDDPGPVILGGDFNAVPESESIAHLDEFFTRTCQTGCGGTIPVENPDREIDFIMLRPSERFEVISHQVISETYASDHLPVLAELKVK